MKNLVRIIAVSAFLLAPLYARAQCGPNGCGISMAPRYVVPAEQWVPIPGTTQLAHYRNGVQVGARNGSIYRTYDAKADKWGPLPAETIKPGTATIKPMGAKAESAGDDALAQVNARRMAADLRPYILDRGLLAAALAAAQHRAAHRIAAHTDNDFAFLPAGVNATAAGCNIATPGGPEFMTCAMYEPNCTHAGAATVTTDDGRVYHHLFVR